MDADFWLQKWQEGQIGFHRHDVCRGFDHAEQRRITLR